ncbi:hypothetical protein B484DRAFT_236476 [Ochromonadaceae sp. CCMP2298]|nr:hypothetical protein B484DRAFT_236476 [Ochromonadaceae sp. CCMP2298]
MIGLILFQNANRIDWRNVSDSAPAFLVLFYIPFTYSIIQGVTLGYIMYLAITLCTGELLENFLSLLLLYVPSLEPTLEGYTCLLPYLTREPSAYRGVGVGVGADGGVGTGVGVGASSSSQSLIPEGGMDGMGRMDMDMGMGGMRMGGMGISADGTESGLGRGVGLGLAQSGQGPTLSLSHPSALTQSPRSALTHSSPSRSRRPSLAPQRSRRGTIIENSGLLAFGLDMSMDIHELEGEEWERGSGGQRSASSES